MERTISPDSILLLKTARAEGINTLSQDYIAKALRDQRPVLSKLFKTARGPYAVSIAYPVRFRDTTTSGVLAVLFRPEVSIGAIVRRIRGRA